MKDSQKKYLDKVVDLIVRETRIDYEREVIYPPSFLSSISYLYFTFIFVYIPLTFTKHCKDTYGLDGDEIEYVWSKYTNIIKEKIK